MNDAPETNDVPDWKRILAVAAVAVALTGLFMLLRFPYERIAVRLVRQVEQQSGTRIGLGPVGVSWVRWAPGLAAEAVQIVQPDGTRYDLDRVGVRPALSFAWLRGDTAMATEVESAQGNASGVVYWGETPGYTGSVANLDLEALPQDRLGSPLYLKGRLDADLDFVMGPTGPEGEVSFEAHEGIVTHPELPLPMPFESLIGDLELGGDAWVRIRGMELESPLATGRATGSIGRGARFGAAPLQLSLEFTVSEAIRGSLNKQGVEVGHYGQIKAEVTGTPNRPIVR